MRKNRIIIFYIYCPVHKNKGGIIDCTHLCLEKAEVNTESKSQAIVLPIVPYRIIRNTLPLFVFTAGRKEKQHGYKHPCYGF